MDIEEARRRLAERPLRGDPTAMPGETLQEKADRLRAEQGPADDRVRATAQPNGTALIWLPYVDYLDTQAGPVEVGLDREVAAQLYAALGLHLGAEARTEWGARFEDGTTMLRPNRELAECTVRAIQGRHGEGRLMQRQVITNDWTEEGA